MWTGLEWEGTDKGLRRLSAAPSATGPKSVGLHVRSGLGADTRARARVETGARSRACMRIHDAGAVLASFGSALPFPPGGGA